MPQCRSPQGVAPGGAAGPLDKKLDVTGIDVGEAGFGNYRYIDVGAELNKEVDLKAVLKRLGENAMLAQVAPGVAPLSGQSSVGNYKERMLSGIHMGLDAVGVFVPGFGDAADGLNAVLYWWEGDNFNAGASLVAMIPLAGILGTVGKYLGKGAKAIDDTVEQGVKGADDIVQKGAQAGKQVDEAPPRAQSNPPKGRFDVEHDNYDLALGNARKNAGDLGPNRQSMIDPETGTLIGERSADGRRGWRIDNDHVNWWDWSDGKKGGGGRYGHDFFPPSQTGPHSKFRHYTEWE